jgi:CRP/FNR family transcriptional regulator, cyclic AMP receptor protein
MALQDVLREHPFVAGLSDSQLVQLATLAREVSFEENELVLMTGQRSRQFYLLLTGSVCVEARSRAYTVSIQALGPGEAFGWSALLDSHDTLFQVRAREHSRALCLSGTDLAKVFREDAELAAEMFRRALHLVAGRVQATEAMLGQLCGMRFPPRQPGQA